MKRLAIGIDIDGVIVDAVSSMLPLLSEVSRRPLSYEELWSRHLGEVLDIDEKTVAFIWEQTLGTDLLRHALPVTGAIEGMSMISKHEIWLVTGRPITMQRLTQSWLAEYAVKYDQLVFEKPGNKLSVKRRFDVFVEDYLDDAVAFSKAGVFSILFDQPWNRGPILCENCQRVYDWNGVVRLITELELSRTCGKD